MLTLAINSATHLTSVALISGGKVLCEKNWSAERNEAEKILPGIFALLKKSAKRWENIDEVFVVAGPGPFTGLRVGVTTANVIAWTTGSKIKTANVFEYLLSRLPKQRRQDTAIVIKGGGDFFALLLPQSKKERLVHMSVLPELFRKSKVKHIFAEMKTGDLSALKKYLAAEKVRVKPVNAATLMTFGKASAGLLKTAGRGSKTVKPLYLQKPHITRSKKEVFV